MRKVIQSIGPRPNFNSYVDTMNRVKFNCGMTSLWMAEKISTIQIAPASQQRMRKYSNDENDF